MEYDSVSFVKVFPLGGFSWEKLIFIHGIPAIIEALCFF